MRALFRLILFFYRRKMQVVAFSTATLLSSNALAAEDYSRFSGQFRASDFANKQFGKPVPYPAPQSTNLGSVSLNVRPSLDCGRVDLVSNYEAQFAKLREQFKAFTDNLPSYISAAPMMVLCYTQPQVCALIRHDSFQLSEQLQLTSNACAAIDKFISNQADKGARELQAEAKKNCVEEKLASGSDMAGATQECSGVTGLKMRDISRGIRNVTTQARQKALYSMLGYVNESASYEFIASMLGEIEIQGNGYWQPIWPRQMLKPNQVAMKYISSSAYLICNQLRPILEQNAPQFNETDRVIASVIRDYLTIQDADAIEDLYDSDRVLACNALGRAIGVMAAKKNSSKHSAVLTSALTNPAVPSAIRDEYRARASTAFEALERSLNAEQIPALSVTQSQVRELASYMRRQNRKAAARLSSSKVRNDSEITNETTDCIDSASCD